MTSPVRMCAGEDWDIVFCPEALLDEATRTIQVAMVHPHAIPEAATPLLPTLPFGLERNTIDQLIELRPPE